MAERITTIAEVRGQIDDVNRKLEQVKQKVKGTADTINRTKATLKVDVDDREARRKLRDFEREKKRIEAEAARVQRQQMGVARVAATGGNPAGAIGGLGLGGIAAVAGTVAGTSLLRAENLDYEQSLARRRGDIAGEAEAESQLNQMREGVPLFGPLAAALHERVTGEQAYIKNLEALTKAQDKVTDQMAARASATRATILGDEQRARELGVESEMQGASPARRAAIQAREAFAAELRSQETRNPIELAEGTVAGDAAKAVRDALGMAAGEAARLARRAEGTARTRAFTRAALEEQQAQEAAQQGFSNERGRRMRERYSFSKVVAQREAEAAAEGDAIREQIEGDTQRRRFFMREAYRERQREAAEQAGELVAGIADIDTARRRQQAGTGDTFTDLRGRFTGASKDEQAQTQRQRMIELLEGIERKTGVAVTS